jgi:hypothetical protein
LLPLSTSTPHAIYSVPPNSILTRAFILRRILLLLTWTNENHRSLKCGRHAVAYAGVNMLKLPHDHRRFRSIQLFPQ